MNPRIFARVGGIVMLLMGVLALLPAFNQSAAALPALKLTNSYGLFVGIFPMNILNKIALIVFGATGLWASTNEATNLPHSITWSRIVAVVMGTVAVLGLIPATNSLFGYWPLFGYEVLGHAVFAILGGYFGYALTSKVPELPPTRKQAKAQLHPQARS